MDKKKAQKPKKWRRRRHAVLTAMARVVMYPFVRFGYGCKITPFRAQGNRPYLILYNHQTPFDQFFIAYIFKGATYYVATEDIFSAGFVSTLLRYSVAPIPIKKATLDVRAVIDCMKVAKEGGTIAIAPEGNRTYSGKTCYIKPGIVALAKKLAMPIAFVRIEDGFGVCPRFSDVKRKGGMRAFVSKILEPEAYVSMENEDLYQLICRELSTNESESGGRFRHKKRAEYMERLFYFCPTCGMARLESAGSRITCLSCGTTAIYGEDKTFSGVGKPFAFSTVADWYDAQETFVRAMPLDAYLDKPAATDTANFFRVIPYKKKVLLNKDATLTLFSDRIEVDTDTEKTVFAFSQIKGAAVLGRNKLGIYSDNDMVQFKGGKRFNALKYVNFYYHFSAKEGNQHDEFLGL